MFAAVARTHYVCLDCRVSYKQGHDPRRARVCPRCTRPLIHAGSAFEAPPRRDVAAWRTLAVLLHAGVAFHKSCCDGPGYRPRNLREVRQRLRWARRNDAPVADALTRCDLP
ncbi:deoxyxylulose-5-phosphate synthase [Streptomyces triticagri]|uniref:Deoxyxylulose-5-phosphate synthase n=1 Tax=Streptomyces triticagri TaxID=2293568 RepID=A0A372LVH8_9ACTN|nr:deoxyxylulose-5-phosphate synthase [Streptomyces triticagri]RFU82273.1 deoxyxylulose-5-phosphate synthase [Streptomyces triticagri]